MAIPRTTAARIVATCLIAQMGLGLGGYVFVAFLKPIVADLGWTRAAFSAGGSPLLLAIALSSPLIGRLTERFGSRVVFSCGILLVAGTLVGFSLMTALWHFWALGLLLGIGMTGLGDIPVGAVITRWFGHGRGLALGLVYTGSNIGGAIVPVLATAIAAQSSWRVALQVLAGLGAALILPFAVAGIPRSGGSATVSDAPEAPGDGLTLAEARRTREFWLLALGLFGFYFYYLGVNHHMVAFLTDSGFTQAEAARRFGAAVAVGIAGKIGMGLVGDRVAARRATLITFGLLAAGSILLIALGRAPSLLPLFLVLHGFTVAAENVMLPLVVAECFGTAHVARIYGALMMALLPGGIAGPTFAGWVFDTTGSYRPAFTVFVVTNLLVLAGLSRLRPLGQTRKNPVPAALPVV